MTNKQQYIDRLECPSYSRSKAPADFDALIHAFTLAMGTQSAGVLIMGDTGNGKTTALCNLLPVTAKRAFFDCKLKFDCERLICDGDTKYLPFIEAGNNVILDDIGRDRVIIDYADKIDSIYDFVIAFYEHGQKSKNGARFFGTTNNTIAQLKARYDNVMVDRLMSMVILVNFHGGSQREMPRVFGKPYERIESVKRKV